jgi:hypothetical protein
MQARAAACTHAPCCCTQHGRTQPLEALWYNPAGDLLAHRYDCSLCSSDLLHHRQLLTTEATNAGRHGARQCIIAVAAVAATKA